MTLAICYNCGEKKFGAFCPCPKCNVEPESEYDKAISLAITDHYLSDELLEETSIYIMKHCRPPELPQEVREDMAESIRQSAPILENMKKKFESALRRRK